MHAHVLVTYMHAHVFIACTCVRVKVGRAGRLGVIGTAITFINNTSKSLFLGFSELMGRSRVSLPPQLTTSPHLTLQREQRKRQRQSSSSSSSTQPSSKRQHKAWNLKL